MEAPFLHYQATILLSQLGGIKHWRYRLLVYSVGPILIFVWLGSKKAKMCNGKDAFAIKSSSKYFKCSFKQGGHIFHTLLPLCYHHQGAGSVLLSQVLSPLINFNFVTEKQ